MAKSYRGSANYASPCTKHFYLICTASLQAEYRKEDKRTSAKIQHSQTTIRISNFCIEFLHRLCFNSG